VEQSAAASSVKTNYVLVTAFKVSIFMLVMVFLSAITYGFFWGVFSASKLVELLGVWRVAEYQQAMQVLLKLSLTPLTFAILVVVAPLVGWWIYSRVESSKQTSVGWSAAGLFALWNLLIGLFDFLSLGMAHLFMQMFFMVIGNAILLLYTMLLMGIGFNLPKLFKIKL